MTLDELARGLNELLAMSSRPAGAAQVDPASGFWGSFRRNAEQLHEQVRQRMGPLRPDDAAEAARELAEGGPRPLTGDSVLPTSKPVKAQSFDDWLAKTAKLLEERDRSRR